MINEKQVLVADDDPVVRHLVEALLKSRGYSALVFASGGSATQFITGPEFTSARPAIALIDFMLGDMSGVELMRVIRANDPHNSMPIVMLSANTEAEISAEGASPDFYLEKPFQPARVLAVVEEAFERLRNI